MQYVNFFPGEFLPWEGKGYLKKFFKQAAKNNIGLGGPDLSPYKKGAMNNSYKFFHQYKHKLAVVGIAVQYSNYSYINPKTNKKYTIQDFVDFGKNYLGVDIIFWNVQEPFYSQKLKPYIESLKKEG